MINEMERNKLSKSSGDLQRKKTDFPGTLPFKLDNFDLLYRKYAHGITIISAWDDNYKVMEISIEPTVCFKIRAYSIEQALVSVKYQGKGLMERMARFEFYGLPRSIFRFYSYQAQRWPSANSGSDCDH